MGVLACMSVYMYACTCMCIITIQCLTRETNKIQRKKIRLCSKSQDQRRWFRLKACRLSDSCAHCPVSLLFALGAALLTSSSHP